MDLRSYAYTDEDKKQIKDYARNALEVYTKENQQMDIGSTDELLQMRSGVLLQLEGKRNRLRGSAGYFSGEKLSESIISSVVYSASSRSMGDELQPSELADTRIRMRIIEKVHLTDEPLTHLTVGDDCVMIKQSDGYSWLHPQIAEQQNWSAEEYLDKTCRKANKQPDYWKNNLIMIVENTAISE